MTQPALHRFEQAGRKFVADPETCFCFECDDISWEVIARYPHTPLNQIYQELEDSFARAELEEVVGELEWLRACKSILPPFNPEAMRDQFALKPGLKLLTAALPATPHAETQIARAAMLLFARSGEQRELRLVVAAPLDAAAAQVDALVASHEETQRLAALSGKSLAFVIRLRMPQDSIPGHSLYLEIECTTKAAIQAALKQITPAKLSKTVKSLATQEGIRLSATVLPHNGDFAPGVAALLKAGFDDIALDLQAAYVAKPDLDPRAMLNGMRDVAIEYAQDLLKGRYYRLEPIAGLFKRIYDGTPLRRADGIGVHELAVDDAGAVYPSPYFAEAQEFCIGDLNGAGIDEDALGQWNDMGVLTTRECVRCWARHFCGGGHAAVHHALSGDPRRPAEAWCNAQRDWTAASISAFNVLSANGVNFTRIHAGLGRNAGKVSWLKLARAAFTMQLGIRNIEESDAEWLQQWENWNPAAYFTLHESGMLVATRYDREMDALHPPGYQHEFVILRRKGGPCGLLRVRPERIDGLATVWVYLHDAADYDTPAVRKSFRALLDEAGKQQAIRSILTPAGPYDHRLGPFLTACGYAPAGEQKDALFLHGKHHDVAQYALTLG